MFDCDPSQTASRKSADNQRFFCYSEIGYRTFGSQLIFRLLCWQGTIVYLFIFIQRKVYNIDICGTFRGTPAMINSLLNSIQNLITLSPTEIDIVTSLFKEKTYKKGDFFLEEGRICKQVGFIAKGLLRYGIVLYYG